VGKAVRYLVCPGCEALGVDDGDAMGGFGEFVQFGEEVGPDDDVVRRCAVDMDAGGFHARHANGRRGCGPPVARLQDLSGSGPALTGPDPEKAPTPLWAMWATGAASP
jgi:hypothetical protein